MGCSEPFDLDTYVSDAYNQSKCGERDGNTVPAPEPVGTGGGAGYSLAAAQTASSSFAAL